MAFDSGVDARHNLRDINKLPVPGENYSDYSKYYNDKFTEFLMVLGLDELKVN